MSKITNMSVAKLLGISEATASRLRAGQRVPSYGTQIKIKHALDWPLMEQFKELYRDDPEGITPNVAAWSSQFERVIREHFEAESATIPS